MKLNENIEDINKNAEVDTFYYDNNAKKHTLVTWWYKNGKKGMR